MGAEINIHFKAHFRKAGRKIKKTFKNRKKTAS
jgi:hypothetical protein